MQTLRLLIMLTLVVSFPLVMTGCKPEEEEAAASGGLEQKIEKAEPAAEHPAKEHPATAKPKDHPAH